MTHSFALSRVATHLAIIYPEADHHELAVACIKAIGAAPAESVLGNAVPAKWDQQDAVVITYPHSVRAAGEAPLKTLERFRADHLSEFNSVHVLPFFPSSSDYGFSVIDHRAVDPEFGTWDDITSIDADLMVDLVLNHASSQSEWFRQFEKDMAPGRDYFVTADPGDDLSTVVRPRQSPLLRQVETDTGTRHVWCTFSHDQVDLEFHNPAVLLEFLDITNRYVSAGARFLRLDAVAYLFKGPGSPSIHMPKTHEVVRLFRTLLAMRAPGTVLITETNVPSEQNLSYLADGQEADMVYNFSLAPLLVHGVLTGDAKPLSQWAASQPELPANTTELNFIASHDGLGVRPAEGILSDEQIQALGDAAVAAGGTSSYYATPDGPKVYELNVGLWDLLGGLDRFVCAHAAMFAFAGVPAVYIHSLLATPNDVDQLNETGEARTINRAWLDDEVIRSELSDPDSNASLALAALTELIKIRKQQNAFCPTADQEVLDLHPNVFAIRRTSASQCIVAIHNFSDKPVQIEPIGEIANVAVSENATLDDGVRLGPYGFLWAEVDG